MAPRYRVILKAKERSALQQLCRDGRTGGKTFIRARALLLCDAGSAWKVADVAEALGVTVRTIEHVKQRFVEDGIAAALQRKIRRKPPYGVVFDKVFEDRLIALALSNAPEGCRRWTVRLLAEQAVELGFAPAVSHMTVHRVLKKKNVKLASASAENTSPERDFSE